MNDLKLLAELRSEVPLEHGSRLSDAVIAAIPFDERARPARSGATGSRVPRRALRPLLAGTLAAAVGAGVFSAVEMSGSTAAHRPSGQSTIAWSGRPTAAWPAKGHPSYGRAGSAAQLIGYMTRAVASAPGRPPKPGEWVVVKTESADYDSNWPMFGSPDKRLINLAWFSGQACNQEMLNAPPMPATLAPGKKVTAKLSVTPVDGYDCASGGLGGWKSVSWDYLNSLPTDPTALEQILATAEPVAKAREQAVFEAISALFVAETAGLVVPPKLSLTLYRVLQQLPGVTFDTATDLAGRSGIGFAMVIEDYFKEVLVIDPDTYTFMGYKDVVIKNKSIKDTNETNTYSPGQVLGWEALLGQAIVDKPGQLP
jgi:hypothetical protein